MLMYELIVAANILLYKCLWQVGAVQWHWRSPHGPLKENQATFLRPKKRLWLSSATHPQNESCLLGIALRMQAYHEIKQR